ncbi:MAG: hypothetical protein ACKV2O_14795 [Acidimicrobiales bacterium]
MAQRDDWSATTGAAGAWDQPELWLAEDGPARRVSPGERIMLLAFAGLVALGGLVILAASSLGWSRLVVGLPVSVAGVGLFALALRSPGEVGDGDLSALAVLRIERWALTPPALAALLGAALLILDPSMHLGARLSVGIGCLVLFVAFGLLVTRARPPGTTGFGSDHAPPATDSPAFDPGSPLPRFAPRPPGRFDAS